MKEKIIKQFDGKPLTVEKTEGEYFFTFGKITVITTAPYLSEFDTRFLLRNYASEGARREINEKLKEIFNE